jgi:hypothetical protein
VTWDEDGVAEVLVYTEGYPYFIQEYGRRAWALNTARQITLADTEAAKVLVEADLEESFFFEGRIGRLTLQRKPTSLSPVRNELMRSAVIYAPKRGLVDFTVPHCGSFVRRRYPLDWN